MNPNANPFHGHSYPLPKKPIDVAIDEIKLLKKNILELRKELEPLKEDLNLRQEIEKKKDAELVVVNNSWW
tara:strand:+ start:810 stop:1022 length:213 start_codon:yes stop_codon:yes gene_type:complete